MSRQSIKRVITILIYIALITACTSHQAALPSQVPSESPSLSAEPMTETPILTTPILTRTPSETPQPTANIDLTPVDDIVPVITDIQGTPSDLYWGDNCSSQPTQLTVTAHATDNVAITLVKVGFGFRHEPFYVSPGQEKLMEQADQGWKVVIDTNDYAISDWLLDSTEGLIVYWLKAVDPSGNWGVSDLFFASITLC